MQAVVVAGSVVAAAALGGAAAYAGWRRALGPPPPGLPTVLAYHKVGTPELGGTWCTRAQFGAHLDALRRAGFRGIDTAAFCLRLAMLDAASRREVLLTFDDAYASFGAQAWPELQRRGFPVLLFVIAAFVGQRSQWDLPLPGRRAAHLDWPALRALAAQGVEIGSHTATHRDLRRLPDAALREELVGSRHTLEARLGVPVRAVSYPFGRCDARVAAAAAAAGYDLGFAMAAPAPNGRVQRHALRRHGVYVIDTPRTVLDKADPSRRGFWMQDLLTRGIHAVAGVAAAASVTRSQRDAVSGGATAADRNDG